MKKFITLLVISFLYILGGCIEEIILPEMKNGENGLSTIFAFDVLAPTDDHLNGGWVLDIGYDINGDSTLNDNEIAASAPLWHGNDGIDGTNGKDGLNGTNGTLVSISDEGYWILDGVVTEYKSIGIDGTNGTNGTNGKSPYVDDDGYWYVWDVELEIFVTTNIKAVGTNGKDGQTPSLYLLTLDLPATKGHENGGVLVTTVWDKNSDKLIDEDEIVGAYTVWHGNNGADGINGSDGKTPYVEDGYWFYWNSENNTWINGGKSTGTDGKDGSNGVDGKSPYVENGYWYFWNSETNEWDNGGSSAGATGATGDKGEKGDDGENGTIVNYEVTPTDNCEINGYMMTIIIDEGLDTSYSFQFEVCDGKVVNTGAIGPQGPKGEDGADGEDGHSSLITLIQNGDCVDITVGIDIDDDGIIDANEITGIETICQCSITATLDKVAICHILPNGKRHTLYINENAVQAHLNHGDVEGECASQ